MYVRLAEFWEDMIARLPKNKNKPLFVDITFIDGSVVENVRVVNKNTIDWPEYLSIDKLENIAIIEKSNDKQTRNVAF